MSEVVGRTQLALLPFTPVKGIKEETVMEELEQAAGHDTASGVSC